MSEFPVKANRLHKIAAAIRDIVWEHNERKQDPDFRGSVINMSF